MVKAVKEKQKENAVEYLVTVLKAISETVTKNTEALDSISKRLAEIPKPPQGTQEKTNSDFLNNILKQQKEDNKAVQKKTEAVKKAISKKTVSLDDIENIIGDSIEENTERLKDFIVANKDEVEIPKPAKSEPKAKAKMEGVLGATSTLNSIELQVDQLQRMLSLKTDKNKADPNAPEIALNYDIPMVKELMKQYSTVVDKKFLKDNINMMYQNLTALANNIEKNQEISETDIAMVKEVMNDLKKLDYERYFKSLDQTIDYLATNIKDGTLNTKESEHIFKELEKYINANTEFMETNNNKELIDLIKLDIDELKTQMSTGAFSEHDIDNLNNILVNSAEARAKAEQEIREEFGTEDLSEDTLKSINEIKNMMLKNTKDERHNKKEEDKEDKTDSEADSLLTSLSTAMPHLAKAVKGLLTLVKSPAFLLLLSASVGAGAGVALGKGVISRQEEREKERKAQAKQNKMDAGIDLDKIKEMKKILKEQTPAGYSPNIETEMYEKFMLAKGKLGDISSDKLNYANLAPDRIQKHKFGGTPDDMSKEQFDEYKKEYEKYKDKAVLEEAIRYMDKIYKELPAGSNEAVDWLKNINPEAKPNIALKHLNPGNLRDINSADGYKKFNSMEEGLNALKGDLMVKMTGKSRNKPAGKDKIETLGDMIKVYAPNNENDTEAYIKHMEKELGVSRDTKTAELVSRIDDVAKAVVKKESGQAYDYIYLEKVKKKVDDEAKDKEVKKETDKTKEKSISQNNNISNAPMVIAPSNQSQTNINIAFHTTKLRDDAMGILVS